MYQLAALTADTVQRNYSDTVGGYALAGVAVIFIVWIAGGRK